MTNLYVSLVLLFSLNYVESRSKHVKILNLNATDDLYHGKFVKKDEVCKNRDVICKSDFSTVCAMRFIDETIEHKTFNNTCYLFLNNLCEHFGNEFHIVETGSCKNLDTRKFIKRRTDTDTETVSENIDEANTVTEGNVTEVNEEVTPLKANLRSQVTTKKPKPKYLQEDASDGHPCPPSCPQIYEPVCMSANRGEGKYFKFYTFYNHCFADMYYCIHFEELGPPPGVEYEQIHVSNLGWSFCGAYRYLQFARYSETISSMGHYGWLAGKHRYSHIMEPHERIPGYGK